MVEIVRKNEATVSVFNGTALKQLLNDGEPCGSRTTIGPFSVLRRYLAPCSNAVICASVSRSSYISVHLYPLLAATAGSSESSISFIVSISFTLIE